MNRIRHLVCLAFAALLVAGAAKAAVYRWEVSTGGNGHYYEPVVSTSNWTAASAAAAIRGGYLATITSAEENAFVHGLVQNMPDMWLDEWNGPWIGGFQPAGSPEPSGGWTWCSREPWGYTNWWPGQPDNAGGVEDYLQFHGPNHGATWNDVRATSQMKGFVVEYNYDPGDLGGCVPNWGTMVFSDDFEGNQYPSKYGDRYLCSPSGSHSFSVVDAGGNHRLRHVGGTSAGGGNGQLFVRDLGLPSSQIGGWMYARATIYNIQALHPARWFGVGVRVDTLTGSGYYAQLQVNGELHITRATNWNDCQVLATAHVPAIAEGDSTVVSLKLEAGPRGTLALSCCVKGEAVLTVYEECYQLTAGTGALFSSAGTTEFDDFVVVANPPPVTADPAAPEVTDLRITPSPATSDVRLDFALTPQTAGRVTMMVLDVAGARVRKLEFGQRAAGLHTALWDGLGEDGQRVRPGTYFCRLFVDGRPIGGGRAVFLR